MRVALIVEWLDPRRGGAETSTRQFIRHLLDLGIDLEVFTRSEADAAPGVVVHTVPGSGTGGLGGSRRFPAQAAEAVRGGAYDIVHAVLPCLAADIYEPRGGTVAETIERNVALRRSGVGRQLKRLTNRFNTKQRSRLRLERRLLQRSPRPMVVAISGYVSEQLTRHYRFPTSHVRRIFNGVDADTANEAERRADRARIRGLHAIGDADVLAILIAHNFKLKGVRRWIEAFARIHAEGVASLRSLVIGGKSTERWQRLVDRLGLAHRLHFVGPTEEIQAYHHAADFLVHPTYYDPCSRVVLEGLASGLACITTRFDGASEIIEDGDNGFVLDSPDDVEALAERAMRLMEPALRRRFAERAAALGDRISMRRHAAAIVALYELTCQERDSR